ncbi:META domain-containing protein [Roseicyclus sp.]
MPAPRSARLALAAALAAALAPAGTATAQEMRSLTGSATYLDRMALPPEAVLLLEATGPDGGLLAEARIPTEGRQVPIPFTLGIPSGTDTTLRAGLAIDGQVLWLSEPVPVPVPVQGAGDTAKPGALVLPRFQPVGFTSALRCTDGPYRLGFAGEAAVLGRDGARIVLQPAPAASGARFAAAEDPATWVWLRGDRALVSIAGAGPSECRAALPLPEGGFRAGGNEPFWSVTVARGSLSLARAGFEDVSLQVTDSDLSASGDIIVTASDPTRALHVVLERRAEVCRDTMSGLPHPEAVALSMGDETLTGCGGDPWALLTGRTWVVEEIGGAGVIEAAQATLGFDAAGRVFGNGSCNGFNGAVEMTGEGLAFGAVATTLMACPEAVMAQERRLFDALAGVYAFDIDDSGALVLIGPSGPALTARAAP